MYILCKYRVVCVLALSSLHPALSAADVRSKLPGEIKKFRFSQLGGWGGGGRYSVDFDLKNFQSFIFKVCDTLKNF